MAGKYEVKPKTNADKQTSSLPEYCICVLQTDVETKLYASYSKIYITYMNGAKKNTLELAHFVEDLKIFGRKSTSLFIQVWKMPFLTGYHEVHGTPGTRKSLSSSCSH